MRTPKLEVEYHPEGQAKPFQVVVGEKIEVSGGASPVEALQGLSLLFDENGKLVRNKDRIHIATSRSLAFFDRDGNFRSRKDNEARPQARALLKEK